MSAPPLHLGALFTEAAATFHGCGPETPIAGVAVDSRQVAPGVLFVAVPGLSRDGHEFVAGALAAGAAAVVVERARLSAPVSGPHVVVPSIATLLPGLCARAWGEPGEQLRLAGVTGTNGKTT